MNRLEVLYFSKQSSKKGKGLRALGLIFGIVTLLAVIGGLALLFYPFGDGVANTVIWKVVGIEIDACFFALATIIAFIYLLVGGIKMLAKSVSNNGNYGFPLTASLAVFFFLTAFDYAEGLFYNLFVYAFLGCFALRVLYQVVSMRSVSKAWEKTEKKLCGAHVIAFIIPIIAIAGFAFLPIFVPKTGLLGLIGLDAGVELVNGDILGYLLALVLSYASSIGLLYDSVIYMMSAITVDAVLTLVFSLLGVFLVFYLATTILMIFVNVFKMGLNPNFVRGSKYFSKSSPYKTAIAFLVYAIVYNGLYFFVTFFGNADAGTVQVVLATESFCHGVGAIVTLILVLILSCVYSAILRKDKKRVETTSTVVVETETEEVLDQTDAVVENAEIPEQPILAEETKTDSEATNETVVEPEEVPETVLEEEVIEEKAEEKKEEIPQNAFNGIPNAQTPYAIPMYNPQTGQTVYYVPYGGQVQPIVQPIIQQAPQPIVVQQPYYVQPQQYPPYGMPPQQPYGYGAPQQPYGMPPQQPYPYPPQQNANEQPVQNNAGVDYDDEDEGGFNIVKKTLAEKVNDLSATEKNYYKQIIAYANGKVGVKHNKGTYADTISYGRDLIVKVQIKQGKIVCNFNLVNFKVKEMLKSKDFSAKQEKTVIKVKDKATVDAVKNSIDMAYELALEAKEARHQEQLRKRREARAAKKNA